MIVTTPSATGLFRSLLTYCCCLVFVTFSVILSGCSQDTQTLTIYSARSEHLIKPLFDAFTKQTGIPIAYSTNKAGVLIQKLKQEGEFTPADILLTVDAGNLWFAKNSNLLQSVRSSILNQNIPSQYRDPENHWFGFSLRTRAIVYHQDKVTATELLSYEDLANQKWKNRLALRTSKKIYNQSLVSMLFSHHGFEKTVTIISGWVNNLAIPPLSSDTKVIDAIEAGTADIGIVNSYYLARKYQSNPDYPVKIFYPNQTSTGTHVNVSGAGVLKHAKNPTLAIRFLEWLSTDDAQELFANLNMEYPIRENIPLHHIVNDWGTFKKDTLPVYLSGKYQSKANEIFRKTNYY